MLPEGWQHAALSDLISGNIRNGYSPNSAAAKTGYWVLSLGALTDSGINSEEIKPVEPEPKVLQSLLRNGDFLISRSNTPDKVGRSIRFTGEIHNCSYPDLMMRFRANEELVAPSYLEAVLKSFKVKTYFRKSAAGSSGSMVKINKTTVEKTPIPLPPLPEQKKIAEILSTWDKAIETVEKLIENSQQKKKALMQQLLTGKKRFPGFGGEWKDSPLNKLCSISKGTQLNRSELTETGDFPVINGGIEPSGYTDSSNCPKDTITVSEGGNSCGFVNLIRQSFWCGGHCYALSDLKIDRQYLYHFLKFSEHKIMRLRVGSGLPNIQKKAIESVKVSVPDLTEQKIIAKALDAADNEVALQRSFLELFKSQKKALMQQLLTGKRRVQVN